MSSQSLFHHVVAAAGLLITMACGSPQASAQKPHPKKAVYADPQSWTATAPGSVVLKQFRPFRAVYDREYTQASGPGAGGKRQDRVIVHADEVAWDGTQAVAITVLDSGVAEHADTNMRALLMVVGLADLRVLFEIGPVPGKAKDYYIGLFTEQEMRLSMVDTTAQTLRPQKVPTNKAGFGPGSWVMASMKLEAGLKINLAPYYSPQANPISQSSYGRVVEHKTIIDGSGKEHSAWVLETPGWYGPGSPKVLQLHLKDTPPYFLGTEIYNYDTGERKRFVWLRSVELTTP